VRRALPGLLLLAAAAGAATAAPPPPALRYELAPRSVVPGEPVHLRLTLLVPTWFSKPQRFPSFELPNCAVRELAESTTAVTAEIDGQAYSGLVREYRFHPQVEGRFQVDARAITVTYMHPRRSRHVVRELTLPAFEFTAQRPPAAADLEPFLAATALKLEEQLELGGQPVQPGKAVIRTVSAHAEGVPAMFLPPLLPGPGPAGVSAYPDAPRVAELGGTGGAAGRRTETVAYVPRRAGRFTLPPVRLRWWNRAAGRLETASLPAHTVTVAAAAGDGGPWPVAAAAVAALALGTLAWWRRPLARRWRSWRRGRGGAGARARERVHEACRRRDAAAAYAALLDWLAIAAPGAVAREAAAGDPDAAAMLAQLEGHLYAPEHEQASFQAEDFDRLQRGLRRLARRLAGAPAGRGDALPRLNP